MNFKSERICKKEVRYLHNPPKYGKIVLVYAQEV